MKLGWVVVVPPAASAPARQREERNGPMASKEAGRVHYQFIIVDPRLHLLTRPVQKVMHRAGNEAVLNMEPDFIDGDDT